MGQGPGRAQAQARKSSCAGPRPKARSGGPPMSESTIRILMLAATVLWPCSVLRFSFACGLRPHAKLNSWTAFTSFFTPAPLFCFHSSRWPHICFPTLPPAAIFCPNPCSHYFFPTVYFVLQPHSIDSFCVCSQTYICHSNWLAENPKARPPARSVRHAPPSKYERSGNRVALLVPHLCMVVHVNIAVRLTALFKLLCDFP